MNIHCKYSKQIFGINIPHINTVEILKMHIMQVFDGEAKYSLQIFGANIQWKYSTEKFGKNCLQGDL